MITIKTDKFWNPREGECRKITEISGVMAPSELPHKYVSEEGPKLIMYNCMKGDVFQVLLQSDENPDRYKQFRSIEAGSRMSESEFQKWITGIRAAGQRLHEIRAAQRERRESWKGEETFCI